MTNHLPLKVSKDEVSGWTFERDEDALVLQAKGGLPEDMEAVYVGCLPVEIEGHEQEVRAASWVAAAAAETAARARGWQRRAGAGAPGWMLTASSRVAAAPSGGCCRR